MDTDELIEFMCKIAEEEQVVIIEGDMVKMHPAFIPVLQSSINNSRLVSDGIFNAVKSYCDGCHMPRKSLIINVVLLALPAHIRDEALEQFKRVADKNPKTMAYEQTKGNQVPEDSIVDRLIKHIKEDEKLK